MITFNNFYRLITGLANGRFVYQQNEVARLDEGGKVEEGKTLSDDPLAGIDLQEKKVTKKGKEAAEKAKASVKTAKAEKPTIDEVTPEEEGVSKEEYNERRFKHEVMRAKGEVAVKVEEQFGGLFKDIENSANLSELEFHYNRAVKTFENMKNEMDALEFIAKGVDPSSLPEDSDYAKQFKKTVTDLAEKAREMERQGHPEIGGLTFDQIINIMIAARKVHYKKYTIDNFETARLDKRDELEAKKGKMDAELARLLGEEQKGMKPEEAVAPRERVIAAGEAVKKTVEEGRLAYMKKQMENPTDEQVRDWVGYAYRLADALSNPAADIDNIVEGLRGNYSERDGNNIVYMGEVAKSLRKEGKKITTESLVGVLKGYASNDKVRSRLDRQVSLFS